MHPGLTEASLNTGDVKCRHERRTRLLAAIAAHPAEDTPRLAYADWLDESGNEISDDGVRLLVESPLWPRLKRLVLGGNPITDVGAETLAAAAPTSRLENLNLRYTAIGLDGVRALSWAYGGRADVF